jgi:uncharacterized membrane protein YkvA (DUF1232 family)
LGVIIIKKVIENVKTSFAKLMLKLKNLKKEVAALYLASKRKDVPWYAKLIIILVVGYALSPIDLIPDFIPVLGYLDDLIIVPIGVGFAIRLIPENIMKECREQSENIFKTGKPKNWIAGGIIIIIWIVIVTCILIKVLN